MADYNYYNRSPRYTDPKMNKLKAWESMWRADPYFAAGAILGQGMGNAYWDRKEQNRMKGLDKAWEEYLKSQGVRSGNSIGADEKKGATGVPSSAGNSGNDYYTSMNKAFDEYRNGNNGKVLYEGRSNVPRTPQQNNTSGVTVGNAGNGGGVTSVADAYNKMANGSGYNTGNTGLYTNGTRDLGNVIGADANGVYGVPGVIGADANGVYGVPTGGSAPSAANIPRSPQTAVPNPNPTPIPYTPEQLAQIQAYGGFTPEELRRMGAAELVAPPVQAAAPAQASAPAQSSGGLLSAVADNAQAYAPSPISETDDHAPYYANPLSESDDHELEAVAQAISAAQPVAKESWWNKKVGVPHFEDDSQPWWSRKITI